MPDAYWDAFLLRRFPGKTLEELDRLDFGRLMRALHVQEIERIEDLREAQMRKQAKPSPAEWSQIQRHDRLIAEAEHENG